MNDLIKRGFYEKEFPAAISLTTSQLAMSHRYSIIRILFIPLHSQIEVLDYTQRNNRPQGGLT